MSYLGSHTSTTVTIASSASLSDAANLGAVRAGALAGIIVPSTWTTAVISFAAGLTADGTFYPLYNAAGAEVSTGSIVGGTAVWVALIPTDFAGVPFIKVRSGLVGAAVNQSGGDTLTLVIRAV